ncbi:MAG: glucokinase [Parvibaculum sp.]|nr:glucokinase [Parvibaculum sp.]
MGRTDNSLLVADIGGTNARFSLARVKAGGIDVASPTIYRTADYPGLETALAHFLDNAGRPTLAGAAVCAAGPVEGKGNAAYISMTNSRWNVTAEALARVAGVERPRLMNDFAALALSIPGLEASDLSPVGPAREALAGEPVGILGAGTGLGVASLVFGAGEEVVVPGEGGHVDLAAGNDREAAVIAWLRARYGHVSVERVLSGPGLVTLYGALAALSGKEADPALTPPDIAERARRGTCDIASETVQLFCGWLGAVAGDLALTIGARGGIYIGGGIVPSWLAGGPGLFSEEIFRARFEAKGRFSAWLSRIPVHVICRKDAALLGLARAARDA